MAVRARAMTSNNRRLGVVEFDDGAEAFGEVIDHQPGWPFVRGGRSGPELVPAASVRGKTRLAVEHDHFDGFGRSQFSLSGMADQSVDSRGVGGRCAGAAAGAGSAVAVVIQPRAHPRVGAAGRRNAADGDTLVLGFDKAIQSMQAIDIPADATPAQRLAGLLGKRARDPRATMAKSAGPRRGGRETARPRRRRSGGAAVGDASGRSAGVVGSNVVRSVREAPR